MLPGELVAWYKGHGYQFLGLSEHDSVPDHESWVSAKNIRNYAEVGANCQSKRGLCPVSRLYDGVEQWKLQTISELRHDFERSERFILLQDEEITNDSPSYRLHVTAVNVTAAIAPIHEGERLPVIEETLRRIEVQSERQPSPAVGIINHPNFAYAVNADTLARAKSAQFVEIFNGHPSSASRGDEGKRSVERLWDMANAQRVLEYAWPPLFGVAGDDTHSLAGKDQASPGRGWIVVRASQLRPDVLVHAMLAGDFYASTGVVLNRCDFNSATRTLSISVAQVPGVSYKIEFIATKRKVTPLLSSGDERWDSPGVGDVVKSATGFQSEYQLAGDEAFVRATITSSRVPENPMVSSYTGDTSQFEQAFTQPVGWQRALAGY